jgi:hypothetical protein
MPRGRTIWILSSFGLLAAATGLTVLMIEAGSDLNHEVDLCADQTSGKYIWDDAVRARECGREGGPRNVPGGYKQPLGWEEN